jgi:hypothetical protein
MPDELQRTVIIKNAALRSVGPFAAFPTKIIRNASLSLGARLTYALLLSYAHQDDFCFPAQERLANDLGVTDRQVRRFLMELRDKGFIAWKQRGLNLPNIYYILEIDPAKAAEVVLSRTTKVNPDRTSASTPDRTRLSEPDRTSPSAQERTQTSDYEEAITNNQKVVNTLPANDLDDSTRPSIVIRGRPSRISDRALRRTYGLDDEQIGRVHHLVQKQLEILGAGERNHGHYVKRAAEAARDRNTDLLEAVLGDFKQASHEIAVGSRPAYFHAMYHDAALARGKSDDRPAPPMPPTQIATDDPVLGHTSLESVGTVLTRTHAAHVDDGRLRIIADAEGRGFTVPDHIRNADLQQVRQWWASLPVDSQLHA